jgi:hypothetical protein
MNIPNDEAKKLLANIRQAFHCPDNKAAWCLGRLAQATLEDYLRADEESRTTPESDHCDECGRDIPQTGGSLANKHHAETCSLYDPKGE